MFFQKARTDLRQVPVSPQDPLPVSGSFSAATATTSTAAAPTYSEGATTSPLSTDLSGNLRVVSAPPAGVATSAKQDTGNTSLAAIATSVAGATPAGTNVIGKVGIDQTTPGTTDSVTVATGQGAGATIGVTTGAAVITDANGTLQQYLRGIVKLLTTAGTIVLGAGSAVIGHVIVDSGAVTVTNATAANLKVDLSGTAANATAIKVDNSAVTQPVSGTITANAGSGNMNVVGPTASGSALTVNPVTTGGRAATTNPTAVADGQVVNTMLTKHGKVIVVDGAPRDLKGNQKTTITASTAETTIVTAGASGVFNDLYGLVLANTGATTTKVDIRDATTGTIISTFEVPTLETRGFMLPAGSAFAQTTAANNWTAQCGSSTSSLEVTALFVKTT